MKVGTILSLPNEYSQFGRIVDKRGVAYTVDSGDIPKGAEVGSEFAYKVEIWGGGGLAYALEDE